MGYADARAKTYATTRPWSEEVALSGYEAVDLRKKSAYATSRPWSDAEAVVGYAAGKGEQFWSKQEVVLGE